MLFWLISVSKRWPGQHVKSLHSCIWQTQVRAWVSNYTTHSCVYLITYPCRSFHVGLTLLVNGSHRQYAKITLIWITGPSFKIKFQKKYPICHKCSISQEICVFVVLCFVLVTQSFIRNSHEVFIHIHQGCFAATGAIVRLPQRQWSKPDGYGKISQCITTTKHSKAKTVCIFLGIYCMTQTERKPEKRIFYLALNEITFVEIVLRLNKYAISRRSISEIDDVNLSALLLLCDCDLQVTSSFSPQKPL